MTTSSDFNLRATVCDVLAATDEADPGVIAGMVTAQIGQEQRDAALTQAMRLFVRQMISETRAANRPANVLPISRRTNRSAKVTAIRDGWQRRLRDRVHVGETEWKMLGDCTYADLVFVASERQKMADRNQARAREYRAMADAVADAGVETFRDLPAEQQMTILGGVA